MSFCDMLERDRNRLGLTVGQVAWRLRASPRKYRELEAGDRSPGYEAYDRIWLFGRPQTFLDGKRS